MPKRIILVVLSIFLLAGCSVIQFPKEEKYDGPTGKLVLNIGKQITSREIMEETTHVKINIDGGRTGISRYIRLDKALAEFPVSITLPIGSYTIKVIAYKKDTEPNTGVALTYDKVTTTIVENQTTQAKLTLKRISGYSITQPTDYLDVSREYETKVVISSCNMYNDIGMSMSSSIILYRDSKWKNDTYLPSNSNLISYNTYYNKATIRSHEDYGKTICYQARISLGNYGTGTNLYFYIPSLTYGESLCELKTVPTGDIDIVIN